MGSVLVEKKGVIHLIILLQAEVFPRPECFVPDLGLVFKRSK